MTPTADCKPLEPDPHEPLAWLALAFALVGLLASAGSPAHAHMRHQGVLVASLTPDEVTAWISTGCSAFMVMLSTGIAAAHRIRSWKSGRGRRRKPARRITPPKSDGLSRSPPVGGA